MFMLPVWFATLGTGITGNMQNYSMNFAKYKKNFIWSSKNAKNYFCHIKWNKTQSIIKDCKKPATSGSDGPQ
jgi:hypothetical protein